MLKTIHSWWWSAYLVIFTCFILPIPVLGNDYSFEVRVWASIVAFLGGLLLELMAHPNAKLSDVRHISVFLRNNPFFSLMLIFIGLSLISTIFSPSPLEAMTGKSYGDPNFFLGGDSYIFNLLVYLNSLLFYIFLLNNKNAKSNIFSTIFYIGIFVSIVCLFEAYFKIGFLRFSPDLEGQLPHFSFYGRGHLAGFLLLPLGIALFYLKTNKKFINYAPILLFILTIGITANRSALLAIMFAFFWLLYFYKKEYIFIIVLSVPIYFLGNYTSSFTIINGGKDLVIRADSSGRSILWKIAVKGIIDRPLLGWGISDLRNNFTNYVTKKEAEDLLQGLFSGETYISTAGNIILTKNNKTKKSVFHTLTLLSIHNFILEIAYSRGILVLIIVLLIFGFIFIKNYKNVYFLTILMYFIYLQTWYIIDTSQAITWFLISILGVNTAKLKNKETLENPETTTPILAAS
jgi:O-antigen ligase